MRVSAPGVDWAAIPPWAVWLCVVAVAMMAYAWPWLRRSRPIPVTRSDAGDRSSLQAFEVRRAAAIDRLQSTYDSAAAAAAQRAAEEAERMRQEAALKEVERLSRCIPGTSNAPLDNRPEYNPLTGQGGGDDTRFGGGRSSRCSKRGG